MKFSRLVILFIFLSPSFYILVPSARAQGIPMTGSNALTLSASSENPIPGEPVTISASSYSFNIDSATIQWSENGKIVRQGIGVKSLNVQAPALGKKIIVNVIAVTPTGSRNTNSITIGSGFIDTIIESNGYVPPFFKGKGPFVYQNTATIIAIPHLSDASGKEYDPATLVYTWTQDDGTVLKDQSGYGKQSLALTGDIVPKTLSITLTAATRDGSAQAQTLINLIPTSPFILFYANDPLYGPLFNKTISNTVHIGSQREMGIMSALFGFNFSSSLSQDLNLTWLINGVEHPELATNPSITLRTPDGVAGVSEIDLHAQGIKNILQSNEQSLNVSFDAGNQKATSTPVTF